MIVKFLLLAILIIHGLIHILGGFSELHVAGFNNLSGKTLIPLSPALRKFLGILWLVTVILFIVSAIGLVLGKPWWGCVTISAAVMSQILIIIWWTDAKYGTLANILILIAIGILR